MFLQRRATQAEYFDSPDRAEAEVVESYAALARANRLFFFAEPFQRVLPKLIGRENCQSLSILDLGGGDGSLAARLTDWAAAKYGWQWRLTNIDLSLPGLRASRCDRNVAGSVLALPFRDASFDVVIASQMTHHLTANEDLRRHFREAWRVARRGIFLSDIHRGPVVYGLVWLFLHAHRFPRHFYSDALLSVKRGFRVGEFQALAEEAGIPAARAWLYYGTRVMLEAKKPASV